MPAEPFEGRAARSADPMRVLRRFTEPGDWAEDPRTQVMEFSAAD